MAKISAMQRLLDNQLTSKFARSLKHSDLPDGWADNPEIVALAEDAYREAGTESPFFKAWSNANKVVDKEGQPFQVLHGTDADFDAFRGDKGNFFTPSPSYSYIQNSDKVYPAYLSLQNPLRTENKYIAETANTFWDEVYPELTAKGYDGIVYASDKDIMKGASGWGDDVPQMVAFSPTQIKSPFNRGTFNPDDPNILRGLIPAVGAGGLLALMGAEEAEAAPYQFPADKRGTVLYEPGLESPAVDPVDLLAAPIGVAGLIPKLASVAAEAPISYGMDKAIGGLLSLFGDEEE